MSFPQPRAARYLGQRIRQDWLVSFGGKEDKLGATPKRIPQTREADVAATLSCQGPAQHSGQRIPPPNPNCALPRGPTKVEMQNSPTWIPSRVVAKVAARAPATLESNISSGSGLANKGKKSGAEKVWREFLSDPSDWWDYRSNKVNPRFPDFKHKKIQRALWLNSEWTPRWVAAKLAAIPPGTIESSNLFWNQRLTRFARAGQHEKTMELFQEMRQNGMTADRFTFVPVLKACASLGLLEHGRRIHTEITKPGFETDIFLESSLVDMYAKCGSIEDARGIFNQMPNRDVVAWNAMIVGYVKCGEGKKALDLFEQLLLQDVAPTCVTFLGVLNACASLAALNEGRRVHDQIVERGYESHGFVGNCLIDMYAKCGSIKEAEKVFNQMLKRDVIAWNTMILGYVKCEQGRKALELFEQMQQKGASPDRVTYVGVLNACASIAALEAGRRAHEGIIRRGYDSNVSLGNCLIDMYAKCGSIEEAERVFNQMSARDVVGWTGMIVGYAKCGEGQKALELYEQMKQQGVTPDHVTLLGVLNACASFATLEVGMRAHEEVIRRGYESEVSMGACLVDMYTKCGSLKVAETVFNHMTIKDTAAWTTMIVGYVRYGEGQKALEVFEQMQQAGVSPDPATFAVVLNACASIAALETGRRVHEDIIQRGFENDVFVGNCLVDMYAKCGSIEEAETVFNWMPTKDVVGWTAMMEGYGSHGYAKEALETFKKMCKYVKVDGVTFIPLLSACSHGGLVDEGLECFQSMTAVYNIAPTENHYACVVDLLGRAGRLWEAEELIRSLPLKTNASIWMSLLSACRLHGNLEMGELSATRVLDMEPDNDAVQLLLSNIYVATGKWDSSGAVNSG